MTFAFLTQYVDKTKSVSHNRLRQKAGCQVTYPSSAQILKYLCNRPPKASHALPQPKIQSPVSPGHFLGFCPGHQQGGGAVILVFRKFCQGFHFGIFSRVPHTGLGTPSYRPHIPYRAPVLSIARRRWPKNGIGAP